MLERTLEILDCSEIGQCICHGWRWGCDKVGYERTDSGEIVEVCREYGSSVFPCMIVDKTVDTTNNVCKVVARCEVPADVESAPQSTIAVVCICRVTQVSTGKKVYAWVSA